MLAENTARFGNELRYSRCCVIRNIVNNPIHPKLDAMFVVADVMVVLARELTRVANAQAPRAAPRRGMTLRPGRGTPMWNALVGCARPHLAARGEKAKLGRMLGVHPSRVHQYVKAGTAMPDAERTLMLLHWVAQKRSGRSPG